MKITIKENYRVIIEPSRSFLYDCGYRGAEIDEGARRICENAVEQIIRHVDYGNGSVTVVHDEPAACSFCRDAWEVNEDPDDEEYLLGEPVCCKKARDEYKALEKG